MANNYVLFSVEFSFKTQEAADLFCTLALAADLIRNGDLDPSNLSETDSIYSDEVKAVERLAESEREEFCATAEAGGVEIEPGDGSTLYVYSEENGNVDLAVVCAQYALAWTEDHESVFALTWADTCSSPRPDQFGGGWAVINYKGTDYGHTWNEVEKAVAALEGSNE